MILNYLSANWMTIASALGNHLWQSTLFAIVVGLLTLILRQNQARARYCLWLAASLKFLIPFSLLISMGVHIAWSRGSMGTNAGLQFAMEEVIQPFAQPTMPVISQATPSTAFPSLAYMLPALVLTVWLCGFLMIILVWCMRWRRISAAIREAMTLREGREVEALSRLERIGGMQKRIEMLWSRTSLEPGIFGIYRPVLLLPVGISDRLTDAQLEVIITHELCHVRRRDNLAAAVHMLVEAISGSILWFGGSARNWWTNENAVATKKC